MICGQQKYIIIYISLPKGVNPDPLSQYENMQNREINLRFYVNNVLVILSVRIPRGIATICIPLKAQIQRCTYTPFFKWLWTAVTLVKNIAINRTQWWPAVFVIATIITNGPVSSDINVQLSPYSTQRVGCFHLLSTRGHAAIGPGL